MKIRITQTVVQNAKPQEKVYSLVDESLPGLLLRVYPSGNKAFYVDFTRDGWRSSHKLGEDRFVDCDHPSDPGHKNVHPSRGCGLRIAKEGAGTVVQRSVF